MVIRNNTLTPVRIEIVDRRDWYRQGQILIKIVNNAMASR